jgi:RNA polymerase sigma factor (TIGR02999 family)
MTDSSNVTQMLVDLRGGNRALVDELYPLIYDELRRIAHRILSGERKGHTLSTTALVHEAYFKLVDQHRVEWQDRAHFCAVAAQAMRRILVDYARRRNAKKRGGKAVHLQLDENAIAIDQQAGLLISLDAALDRLKRLNMRLSQVVDLRFFGGLTEEEMAEVLGVSSRTVRRDWVKARAWLYRELKAAESR